MYLTVEVNASRSDVRLQKSTGHQFNIPASRIEALIAALTKAKTFRDDTDASFKYEINL